MYLTNKRSKIVALIRPRQDELAELLSYMQTVIEIAGEKRLVIDVAFETKMLDGMLVVRIRTIPPLRRWVVKTDETGQQVIKAGLFEDRDVTRLREILGRPMD